ncbi:MAG: hypothetical protein ABFD96_10320 [Armatimonadia bacterium]
MITRLLLLLILPVALTPAFAGVTISARSCTLTLDDTAVVQSLANANGVELRASAAKLPFAQITVEGSTVLPTAARLTGNNLTLTFAQTGTELTYELTPTPNWLLIRLTTITGPRPSHMVMCQLPVNLTQKVGRRLSAAYTGTQAVCLQAANHQPDCSATRDSKAGYTLLRALNQDAPGPKLEGAAVALIVCPTDRLKPILKQASHEFGLLTNEDAKGTPVKDTDLTRGSYWFMSLGEADADKMIDYCKQSGFKQIMLSSGAWCTSPGHYLFNEARFPRKEQSLKALVDKFHQSGILVGMHCFASKVAKRDPYVTPVPDCRFWVDKQDVLATDLTPEANVIKVQGDVREWAGSPVAKTKMWEGGVKLHQEVIIDDEIIQYETIGPDGQWNTFVNCKRGAYGTKPAAHKAGAQARHYGIDGCINGYIIDQNTSLIDETTTRLADIYNYCGFDMIYFDGGEDVDRTRFTYYVSNFQEQVMRKLKKRPIIHMGTIMTHLLWNSFARSATVDTYLATLHGHLIAGGSAENWPTVRGHIDRSVNYAASIAEDMMPGELGWFGIWPREKGTDGLQLDELEYLMCKSLGYDLPISLETSFSQMEMHPLTPGILEIAAVYEDLRMNHRVDAQTCRRLQEKGRDFALIMDSTPRGAGGPPATFIPVETVPNVAGGNDLRAQVGPYGTGSAATLWHWLRDAEVTIPLPARDVRILDMKGREIKPKSSAGNLTLNVGSHRLALITSLPVEKLKQALQNATATHRQAQRIWIQAETGKLVGEMALGSTKGLKDEGAFGDFVVCTGKPNFDTANPWYAEYTVNIPHDGNWALWSRVIYPGGGDQSFGLWLPPDPISLDSERAIGNCGIGSDQWHWTGRGGGSTSPVPGTTIRLNLKQGPFTFRVLAREGRGTAPTNPRLDLICLTDDAADEITDEMARSAMK